MSSFPSLEYGATETLLVTGVDGMNDQEKLTLRGVFEIGSILLFARGNQLRVGIWESALDTLRETQTNFLVQRAVNESHLGMNGGKIQILSPVG
jgi:hypothetical protein